MRLLLTLILMLVATPGMAAPDLGTYRDVEGVRAYRDHQQSELWYLTPAQPGLGRGAKGAPDYGLDIYRYLGRKGTGDQGLFWLRAVLSVGIVRERSSEITWRIRKALRAAGVSRPRLRSVPVAAAEVRLVFADQSQTWNQGTRWGDRQIVLSLDRYMAEILWDAVKAGQTQVSLIVAERLAGVRRMNGKWQEAETVASWTFPIELDMQAHPGHFRRTDIGGRMARGYTGLDVFCFDFLEGADPDLYAKIVEVAIPTAGRDLVEEVTFKADSDYRFRIKFELAKDLDQPYKVRVTRVFKDGRRQVGGWAKRTGESLLDVTEYREPEASSDDREGKPSAVK
jgi:hypothetical protein